MKNDYIKSGTGKILGRIDRNWVFDEKGAVVARYDSKINRTFDRTGKFVGHNDQRLRILGQSKL